MFLQELERLDRAEQRKWAKRRLLTGLRQSRPADEVTERRPSPIPRGFHLDLESEPEQDEAED